MFVISCQIDSLGIKHAIYDLGTSVNVMLKSIYKALNAWPLKETGVVHHLADRSIIHPDGLLDIV